MMWFKSVCDGVTEISTKPRANMVVNTMPIAASSFTLEVSRTTPIRPTAKKPNSTAPTANGTPTM